MSAATGTDGQREAMDATAAMMMVAITFCWGLNQVAVKVSTIGYDPIFLTTLRSVGLVIVNRPRCRARGGWRDGDAGIM